MSESRSIGSLIVRLVAQGVGAYKADVDAAAGATDKAAKAAKQLDGELAGQTKQVKAAGSAMQALASAGKVVASTLVAWKVVDTVGKLVSVQREFDVLNSSLITVTGSSAKAAQEFDWIKRFAATTPYQLNEVTSAFVKMKALGLNASEKALTSYGNTASAMGKGLNQMIEAVADAATGEFERLKEFGIRATKQGDQVSLTFQGVTTTIGSSAKEIAAYLQNIGNVEFAGAMEERAKTLDGALSNLTDNVEALFRTINQGGFGNAVANDVRSLNTALQGLNDAMLNSQKAGDGLLKQLAKGAGFAVGTASVGALNSVFNGFNWTVNSLTGSILDLNENVNLLPDALKTNEQRAGALGGQLQAAEADLSRLQDKLALVPDNIYLKSETYQAYLLVQQLKAAKEAQDKLTKAPQVSQSEIRIKASNAYAEQQAQEIAKIDALMAKSTSVPEAYIKRMKEIGEANATGKLSAEQLAVALESAHRMLSKVTSGTNDLGKSLKDEADLLARLSGYNADYEEQIQRLTAAKNSGRLALDRYNDEVVRLVQVQPGAVAAEKAAIDAAKRNTEAVDDLFDVQEKLRLANEDQIKTGRTMLEQIEFETRLLGLNAEQRAIATMERELESQGIVKGTQAYDAYIAKLREAMAIRSATAAGVDASKELADANKKAAEDSSRYWEDALMRAFESGKSGWQSLWSTIKNTLQTQVLKIFLAPVVGGVSGMANAATGSGGASPFAAYGNPFTNFGGSMGNSIADFGTSMVDKGFTSLGTGIENLGLSLNANAPMVNAFGDALGYATALMAASDGKWGQAAGAAIGTYFGGPIGSAIGSAIGGMVDELFGGGGGPKTESGYGYSIGSPGNVDRLVGGATGSAAVYAKGIEDGWAALASKFGLASSLSVGAFTSTDPEGDALTQVQVAAGLDGQSVYSRADRLGGTANIGNVGRTPEELAAALQEESVRVLFAALKASNLDGEYTAYFASIGDSVAEMTAALDTVVLIKDFRTAMDSLPFAYLRDLSFDAAKGLLQAAGGLQAFGANLSGFYDNFYTESEKTSNLTRNVTDALAAQNIVLPKVDTNLRAWYRSEVERLGAMDLSITANAQAYASVLALQGSVAQLATGAETAAQQIAEAAARLQADITSAQDGAMSAYMSAQADYAAIVAQEQEAAAQSMQAAAAATADAAESIRSALASAGQGIATLIRDLTTTAGGTLDPAALARSTQAAYLDDLRRAQGGDVDASGRVAGSARAYLDASGAVSTNARQAATVAQVVRELGQLPAVKTYEQRLLEAVQGTTTAVTSSSASNAATIAAALSTKLIAELSVTAQSEILKLINFVAVTDQLPDDLKALALADASTMSKTISFVQGSTLTPENKQIALMTETSIIKTYNFVAASELTEDQKQQAFGVLMSGDRVIRVVTGSLLSDDAKQQAFGAITSATRAISIIADSTALAAYKQTALEAVASATKWVHLAATGFSSYDANLISAASSSVTKAVSLALQNSDPWALAVLAAQDRTVSTILNASGGVLTMEQRTLLDGITNYNKNIQIGIKIDSSELSTFQQTLMSIFGTIDITGLAAAGVDLSGVISNEALARLQSVSAYVQSFDWVNTDLPTRASQMHAVRTTAIAYGVSSQDVATAMGVTRDTLASWYDYLNVPFFDRGANVIPQDTLAMVHQGERIIPAADNRELMQRLQSPQANSAALADGLKAMAAELAAVRAELAAIKANTQAGAVHQADSADSLRNLKNNGVQVWTDPAEPLKTEVAA